ncbi:hypothetical protein [Clavibacter californiensis]|uniref:Uncharacterized protein n=1 Tax=Clavibacter californiensis TaxID=1401995 RepID=A0ABX9NCS5_9MICO|nr:hypothetical protein [Clavibacter californiensis]RII94059.1 hypothetical protein DZF98_02655 [Clavibacter californiensis]UKF80588.1 hypothetical protein FGD68_02740 [Clavibacter californiensis]
MAITNLPYDDDLILEGVRATTAISEETRDVHVDFAGTGTSSEDVARISVTTTWTVSAADAVRILAAAIPTGVAREVPVDASDAELSDL